MLTVEPIHSRKNLLKEQISSFKTFPHLWDFSEPLAIQYNTIQYLWQEKPLKRGKSLNITTPVFQVEFQNREFFIIIIKFTLFQFS